MNKKYLNTRIIVVPAMVLAMTTFVIGGCTRTDAEDYMLGGSSEVIIEEITPSAPALEEMPEYEFIEEVDEVESSEEISDSSEPTSSAEVEAVEEETQEESSKPAEDTSSKGTSSQKPTGGDSVDWSQADMGNGVTGVRGGHEGTIIGPPPGSGGSWGH